MNCSNCRAPGMCVCSSAAPFVSPPKPWDLPRVPDMALSINKGPWSPDEAGSYAAKQRAIAELSKAIHDVHAALLQLFACLDRP